MNEVEYYRQAAQKIWPHLLPLIEEFFRDVLRFYQASVVKNPGDGTLAVQRGQGAVYTIPCSQSLANASPGQQVLVLLLNMEPTPTRVAVSDADPAAIAGTFGPGGGADGFLRLGRWTVQDEEGAGLTFKWIGG